MAGEKMMDEVLEKNDEMIEKSGPKVVVVNEFVEDMKALAVQPKKIKKYLEAKNLVDEAKSIVKNSEDQLQDCKLLLEEDIHEYTEAIKGLKKEGLDESKTLLSALYDIHIDDNEIIKDNKIFEAKDDVKPLVLKDVHSGRFTGFVFSILGGILAFGGLIYLATEKLGMTLDVSKLPSNETIQTTFGWFGTQVGSTDNALIGSIVVGAVVLFVMIVLYLLRVIFKSNSNLHFAKKQMKETQKYIMSKSSCKAEMDRVDAHINDALKVLKDYEVVLSEQKGKLKRIFYFEEGKHKTADFKESSIATIKETQSLIEHIEKFIATPMSEEGRLSNEKVKVLQSTKEYIKKLLERLY